MGIIILSSPEPLVAMVDMVPGYVGTLAAFTSQDSLYGGSKSCSEPIKVILEGLMGPKGCERRVSYAMGKRSPGTKALQG